MRLSPSTLGRFRITPSPQASKIFWRPSMSSSTPPVGPLVPSAHVKPPAHTTLSGRFISLAPLSPSHASDLYPLICDPSTTSLWAYMGDGPYSDLDSFANAVSQKAASRDPLYFALLDQKTSRPLGYASLMRTDVPNRVVEVGNIMYAPVLQRTAAATEAMFLLARHVFEDLGYRRYEWKCNALNAPSRRAAARLGFTFEGIFRQHMIVKGRNRDTAWFSMLDGEWAKIGKAFKSWLDESNFDEQQQQKKTLEEIRRDIID